MRTLDRHHDRLVETGALDAELDHGCGRTAQPLAHLVGCERGGRHAVERNDKVVDADAGLRGRRIIHHRSDARAGAAIQHHADAVETVARGAPLACHLGPGVMREGVERGEGAVDHRLVEPVHRHIGERWRNLARGIEQLRGQLAPCRAVIGRGRGIGPGFVAVMEGHLIAIAFDIKR